MKLKILLSVAMILSSTACSTSPGKSSFLGIKKPTQDFIPRPVERQTLANGLQIVFVQEKTLPRISFQMMVKTGVLHEPSDLAGINTLTAEMLEQGTTKKTATQLADEFGFLGTEFQSIADKDYTFLSTHGLSTHKDHLLELFAEVVTSPQFSQKEYARVQNQLLSMIQKAQDQPHQYVSMLYDQVVFEGHPYQNSKLGKKETVQKIRRQDVIRHYFKYYRPNNSVLAVTGNFDSDFMQKVSLAFSGWQSAEVPTLPELKVKTIDKPQMSFFSKKGLAQTQIIMGHPFIPYRDPDYLKVRLANVVLGSAFASRLNLRVRDELGLTYSVHSSLDPAMEHSSFEISTFTRNEKVQQTLEESIKVFEVLVKDGITESELQSAKNLLVGQFPSVIETVDSYARNILMLEYLGVGSAYLSEFNTRVSSISLEQVNEAVKKHLHPEQIHMVVYGDEKLVAPQLKKWYK